MERKELIKLYLTNHYDYISKLSALKTMCAFGYSIQEVIAAYDEIEWEHIN